MDTRKLRIKKEPIDLENLSLPDLDERKCLIKKELKTKICNSDCKNYMKKSLDICEPKSEMLVLSRHRSESKTRTQTSQRTSTKSSDSHITPTSCRSTEQSKKISEFSRHSTKSAKFSCEIQSNSSRSLLRSDQQKLRSDQQKERSDQQKLRSDQQ